MFNWSGPNGNVYAHRENTPDQRKQSVQITCTSNHLFDSQQKNNINIIQQTQYTNTLTIIYNNEMNK